MVGVVFRVRAAAHDRPGWVGTARLHELMPEAQPLDVGSWDPALLRGLTSELPLTVLWILQEAHLIVLLKRQILGTELGGLERSERHRHARRSAKSEHLHCLVGVAPQVGVPTVAPELLVVVGKDYTCEQGANAFLIGRWRVRGRDSGTMLLCFPSIFRFLGLEFVLH
jgi:hypothetical protein